MTRTRSALQRTRRTRRTAERVSHSIRPSRGLQEQASRAPGCGIAHAMRCAFFSRCGKDVVLRALLAPRIQRGDCAARQGQTH